MKKIITSEQIYHNGLANSVKAAVFALEPELFEAAKEIDEDHCLVVEYKLVKKGDVDLSQEAIADPFKKIKKRK
jgi:hypothetical protein